MYKIIKLLFLIKNILAEVYYQEYTPYYNPYNYAYTNYTGYSYANYEYVETIEPQEVPKKITKEIICSGSDQKIIEKKYNISVNKKKFQFYDRNLQIMLWSQKQN